MNEVKLSTRTILSLLAISIFASFLSVALFGASMVALHPESTPASCECDRPLYGELYGDPPAPPINSSALNELKQQSGVCIPCRQPRILPNRAVQPYYVVPSQPTKPAPVQPAQPATKPAAKPVPTPTTSTKCQIALFIDGSAKSTALVNWFQTDPSLVGLRRNCTFETYMLDNDLYRTRYAQIVPPEQFPAIIFQYSDGGHIHAAGKNMIPNSASDLYADLKLGYEKAQSVRKAQLYTGVVKSTGYSWDQEIRPNMQLPQEDCPDGQCPPQWRPGDRVRDLFDKAQETRGLVMWAGSVELITYGLFGLVVLLAMAVLISKLGKK
jgi:hypothetical protein